MVPLRSWHFGSDQKTGVGSFQHMSLACSCQTVTVDDTFFNYPLKISYSAQEGEEKKK